MGRTDEILKEIDELKIKKELCQQDMLNAQKKISDKDYINYLELEKLEEIVSNSRLEMLNLDKKIKVLGFGKKLK